MLTSHEQLFRCDFQGESLHLFTHVRAWDVAEAVNLFVAELPSDGVEVPGEIRVRPLRGSAPATIGRYRPRRRAQTA